MYLQLEINENLANAMRAAAEFKVEVEKIIECGCFEKDGLIIDSKGDYEEMSSNISRMIYRIGDTIGTLLSEIALDEVRKVTPNNNQSNTKAHVSE